jgi:toxin ParE1/3/4
MAIKRLEWSHRSQADRLKITEFYAIEASPMIAEQAAAAIQSAADAAARQPLNYREGKKPGTREYVMRRFPYILIYRVTDAKVTIVRVLHQAMRYFN